ncbi:MAG: 6-carboxytetrahydropterin synthase [Bryobacterales bacterium]|nr:6-carboxytetrahydropterin synthase [Bryobacteraceae bacterium]MDW8129736.1 6-carboxytetrahydropterin synthase [Bryobacterales bacterium]
MGVDVPRVRVTRRVEFSASHCCRRPEWSEEQNRAVFGEAANPHGHGHNWLVEVTLEGEPDPVTGMVLDLKVLKQILQREVIEPMDHRFLNYEVPPFDRIPPTVENLAREIWRRLEPHLSGPQRRLHAVRVYETEDYFAEYHGPCP